MNRKLKPDSNVLRLWEGTACINARLTGTGAGGFQTIGSRLTGKYMVQVQVCVEKVAGWSQYVKLD